MTAELRQVQAIDETMEKASHALTTMDYFEAERLCSRALDRARAACGSRHRGP